MIVLDTHIWLWWLTQNTQLTARWKFLIETSERVAISAASCIEVAWLAQYGRIKLPCPSDEWMNKAIAESGMELLPITPHIARLAAELPQHHRDPQDRLIIATAIANQAKLISADSKFPLYVEIKELLLN